MIDNLVEFKRLIQAFEACEKVNSKLKLVSRLLDAPTDTEQCLKVFHVFENLFVNQLGVYDTEINLLNTHCLVMLRNVSADSKSKGFWSFNRTRGLYGFLHTLKMKFINDQLEKAIRKRNTFRDGFFILEKIINGLDQYLVDYRKIKTIRGYHWDKQRLYAEHSEFTITWHHAMIRKESMRAARKRDIALKRLLF